MSDWVKEEAFRQLVAWRRVRPRSFTGELAESCLRAGLLEAVRQLEARAADIRTIWPNGEYEQIVKTWDVAASDLRALAGDETKP